MNIEAQEISIRVGGNLRLHYYLPTPGKEDVLRKFCVFVPVTTHRQTTDTIKEANNIVARVRD
jgi:hypothetical protein